MFLYHLKHFGQTNLYSCLEKRPWRIGGK